MRGWRRANFLASPSADAEGFLGNLNWNETRLAFAQIDQVKDPATRHENLGDLDNVASSWGRSDLEAAKAWADRLTGTERAWTLAAVLPALACDDPASVGTLAKQWAGDDPRRRPGGPTNPK